MPETLTAVASPIALIPAAEVGHSTRSIRSGELVRVLPGVYARSADWAALAPWLRYIARVHAATLRDPDAVLVLESAAAVLGLPVFGDPGQVHLLADGHSTSRMAGAMRLHAFVDAREIRLIGGIPVTGLADTVVDLARNRHPAVGLAIADAAIRKDSSLTAAQLVALNETRASARGRRHARWALDRASSIAESPLESVDRAVIEWLGFPAPELQVWLGGEGVGDRVDKWWPDQAVAGEGDGDLKYDGRFGDPATAMRSRHERDARLFRNGARAVPHWGWHEALAVDPLEALLVSAGLPVVRPRDSAHLYSMQRALRRR